MAINVTSSLRLDPAQLNLRESRANRVEQRSEQTAETRRAQQATRNEKDDAITRQQVKENRETSRNAARANDEAAAAERRAAQQADKKAENKAENKADNQRRDNDKTIGRNIDTTA